ALRLPRPQRGENATRHAALCPRACAGAGALALHGFGESLVTVGRVTLVVAKLARFPDLRGVVGVRVTQQAIDPFEKSLPGLLDLRQIEVGRSLRVRARSRCHECKSAEQS